MDHKDIRKQIRNVLQEEGPNEAIKLAVEKVEPMINAKLDQIEKAYTNRLTEIDKRSRAVLGFIMGEVKNDMQTRITKNEDSVDAMVEILAESGVTVSDLAAKVAARIPEVRDRKEKAAAAELEANLKKQREAQEAAAAEVKPDDKETKEEAPAAAAEPAADASASG